MAQQVKDLVLPLLGITAVAQARSLAWELLHTMGVAGKKKKDF